MRESTGTWRKDKVLFLIVPPAKQPGAARSGQKNETTPIRQDRMATRELERAAPIPCPPFVPVHSIEIESLFRSLGNCPHAVLCHHPSAMDRFSPWSGAMPC